MKQQIRQLAATHGGLRTISLGKTTGACEYVELGMLLRDPYDRQLWHVFFSLSMVDEPDRVLSPKAATLLRGRRWLVLDSTFLEQLDRVEVMKAEAFASRGGSDAEVPLLDNCIRQCDINLASQR